MDEKAINKKFIELAERKSSEIFEHARNVLNNGITKPASIIEKHNNYLFLETYINELKKQNQWISVSEKLPEEKRDEDGSINSILVCVTRCPDNVVPFSVWNVTYALNHLDWFSHWEYILPPNIEESK